MEDFEIKKALDDAGFDVVDMVDVGNLSELKEEKNIIPPSKNVKLRIKKITNSVTEDKTWRSLKMSLVVEDGIPQADGTTKYKGMMLWGNVTYYADPEGVSKKTGKKYKDTPFIKNRQHLVELQKLWRACGLDLADIKINDDAITRMTGMLIMGDIRQKLNKFTAKDGTKVEEPKNEVGNFKGLPMDSVV